MTNNKSAIKSKKAKEEVKPTEVNSEDTLSKEVKELIKPDYTEPSYGDEKIDYDDVYDEADIASALEMGFIAKALADHKNKVAPEQHPDFDGEHCIDCDTDIPEVRLKMGKIRCVDCQAELELRNKLNGRK